MNNSTINNTVAANNTSIVKEETIMMTTVKELKAIAKTMEIKGYSKMKKEELIMAIEAKKNETTVKEDTTMVDQKKANGEKLAKMLVGAWVWQSTHKYEGLVLFFDSKKYSGKKIASRKRLMKVTGDVIKEVFGEKYDNYNTILAAYKLMAGYGFCTVSEDGKDVSMTDKQYDLCVRQYKALQKKAVETGCKSLKEYICK